MESRRLSLDRVSSLPENIIETILCLVPIRDAVRTSILSRTWRYNWVKIPKLVFNENNMFHKSSEKFEETQCEKKHFTKSCKFFKAIYQVLLMHHGPIHKFTLSMDSDDPHVEIDQIIIYLSRHNTLKKLMLNFPFPDVDLPQWYMLPLSIFSLHQLTNLRLLCCGLEFKPTFCGFGNLTSLSLEYVRTNTKTLLNLLSGCPMLKRIRLMLREEDFDVDENVTFIELFNCLPMIEHLATDDSTILCFAENGVPQELPTALIHLKYLYIFMMMFANESHLHFLGLVIRSSPNLVTIRLDLFSLECDSEINLATLKDYSDVWLEHLSELKIVNFTCSKCELEFVKLMLANSPLLKMVSISLDYRVSASEELKMLKILLQCPRASPVVKIIVQHPHRKD